MLHRTPHASDTPESLQRGLTLAACLTGFAAALWLGPLTLYYAGAAHGLLTIAVGATAVLSLGSFTYGMFLRWRCRAEALISENEAAALRRHRELCALLVQNGVSSRERDDQLAQQIASYALQSAQQFEKIMQEYFNLYADVATDIAGGRQVVDETDTRPLNDRAAVVVPIARPYTNGGPR